MKQVRKRLTYANVMSSIAVFLVLGTGAAFAALGKNTVGTKQLKKNAVKTAKIGPGAVKTGKLGKEAVKAGKLANGAVLTDKLGDAAVTSGKLANDSVLTDKLAIDSVVTGKIAADAVTTDKIANDAVSSEKIAGNAVTTAKITNGAVTGPKLAANSVSGAQIKAGSLLASDVSTFETTATFNFPSIPAGTCDREIATIPGSGATANDSVLVTANADDLILAPEGSGLNLVVLGQGSNVANLYRVVLCNPSAAAVDPPNTRFYVTAFGR